MMLATTPPSSASAPKSPFETGTFLSQILPPGRTQASAASPTLPYGEEVYFISTPSAGLWTTKEKLNA